MPGNRAELLLPRPQEGPDGATAPGRARGSAGGSGPTSAGSRPRGDGRSWPAPTAAPIRYRENRRSDTSRADRLPRPAPGGGRASNSSSVCVGNANIRSTLTASKPCAAARRTASSAAAASWERPTSRQQPVRKALDADRQHGDARVSQEPQDSRRPWRQGAARRTRRRPARRPRPDGPEAGASPSGTTVGVPPPTYRDTIRGRWPPLRGEARGHLPWRGGRFPGGLPPRSGGRVFRRTSPDGRGNKGRGYDRTGRGGRARGVAGPPAAPFPPAAWPAARSCRSPGVSAAPVSTPSGGPKGRRDWAPQPAVASPRPHSHGYSRVSLWEDGGIPNLSSAHLLQSLR